jgi:23S rRNA A2030 N6-methylase RlmJ
MDTQAKKRRRATDNAFEYDSDSDDEVRNMTEDGWPRFILVKPADENRPLTALSPFAVNKAFEGVAPGLSDIKRLRDGSFLVNCKSKRQSELLMRRDGTNFVDRPIKVEVHRTLNSCKGVIRCRDLASSTEGEIKKELASQGVIDVY